MHHDTPSLEALLRGFLLYIILPAWVFCGFFDYLCHKHTKIETTTGLRETILHALMGIQIGLPIYLGLFLEVDVLLLLIMLGVLIFHEYVAHHDVKTTYHKREITVWEIHAHSFLEVIPFVIFGLLSLLKWPAFINLITFQWQGHLSLRPKTDPIDSNFIVGYMLFMLVVGIAPYVEEFHRCWRFRKRRTV